MSEELTPDIVTIETLAQWMSDVALGRWGWPANTRCKYVTLSIDTRRGAFRIEDRDGHEITEAQLLFQRRADLYDEARQLVISHNKASASFIQRTLHIGFQEAIGYLARMEAEGVISKKRPNGLRTVEQTS